MSTVNMESALKDVSSMDRPLVFASPVFGSFGGMLNSRLVRSD
jgi:hypothetical protein